MPLMPVHNLARRCHFLLCLFVFFAISNSVRSSVPSSPVHLLDGERATLPAHINNDASLEVPAAITVCAPTVDESWRRSLPSRLRNKGAPLHRIRMKNGVVLYMLGSSHVSRTSCDDARLLMEHVRPDVLFVELCSQRAGMLIDPPPVQHDHKGTKGKREKASLAHRGGLVYAKLQADYANKLNVTIGGEFRTAFQAALRQQRKFWGSQQRQQTVWVGSGALPTHPRANRPCAVVLGDRPAKITILRAWESLRFFGKVKLVCALLWSSLRQPSAEELKEWLESLLDDRSGENDLLTKAMSQLDTKFPTLKRTIIEERDEFMVAKLRQTAELVLQSCEQEGEKVIVAVVGAGHCSGMLELLRQETTGSCAVLERWPMLILSDLLETKKKTSNDAEMKSLVCDIVQFDYAYASDYGIQE